MWVKLCEEDAIGEPAGAVAFWSCMQARVQKCSCEKKGGVEWTIRVWMSGCRRDQLQQGHTGWPLDWRRMVSKIEVKGWMLMMWIAEMAPYLRNIESSNATLISTLSEKNEAELKSMDEKLKEAEENQGDSEISELLRSRAMYLCRIGDKVRQKRSYACAHQN